MFEEGTPCCIIKWFVLQTKMIIAVLAIHIWLRRAVLWWRTIVRHLLELRRMFKFSFIIILFVVICNFERFYLDFAENFLSASAYRTRVLVISFISIVNIFILGIQNHRIYLRILIFCIFNYSVSF